MRDSVEPSDGSMSHAPTSSVPMHSVGAHFPLSLVHVGKTVHITTVRGNEKFVRRFAELGFIPGAEVKVVSSAQGNIVVNIKGSQFGLDYETALRIMTCPCSVMAR